MGVYHGYNRRLIAIEDIRQLKSRYFRHMDLRDWPAMALVFCRDAQFDCSEGFDAVPLVDDAPRLTGPVVHSRDNIIAWIAKSFSNATSVHHGHCHEITVESSTD